MKCKHSKKGKKCNAHAMNGADYCYFHNPDITKEERKEYSRRGGAKKKIVVEEPLEPVSIETAGDIKDLLCDIINRVRTGSLDVRIANCIGVLSGHMIKAIEISQIETRISRIEEVILKKG